jgi:peptidoglycan/xylan/chitin deacetylase (PgdA/CDA1 family)
MKINVSIDDVSPHPYSSTKVLEQCHSLIQTFPDIKFTLFVPTAYWRTIKPGTTTQMPLAIDQFSDFCQVIRQLPKENFEIGYHGVLHGIPGKSDNDEFQSLSKDEANSKFNEMFKIVAKANLQNIFKPIFRPPAWRMSPGAIEAAKEAGIKVLALSPKDYAKMTYSGAENNFKKVVYYNYNPPIEDLPSILPENSNAIELVYHACEWDKNYFSAELAKKLSKWLQTHRHVEFSFIEDLV